MFRKVLSGFSSLFRLSSSDLVDKEITNSNMNREKDEQYYLVWEGEKVDKHEYDESLPNVWFYQNCIPSEPDEVYIDEFHKDWFGDYRKLEYVHSYIQWLFPIQEQGMNYSSYPLSHKEIQIFREDKELQKKLLKSYKLMLNFYGIKLQEPQDQQEPREMQQLQKQQQLPIGEVCRADNWEERFENLNWNTHNNLRITRILKCLGILGLGQYQAPLVKFFLQETLVNKTLPRVKRSVLDYFIFAVLDEDKRNELIRFAFQHFEPKEEFMWCPDNSKIFRKKKSNTENKDKKTTQHPDDLKNNTEHHEGTISAPDIGLNAGSEDQDAKKQEEKSQSDSKEDTKHQKSGSKAGDQNVSTEAGTNEANSAKAENSVQSENNKNRDGEIPKDNNNGSELDTNKESEKSDIKARDANVPTDAGTLHCTKAEKNQVPSDKTTDDSTCENLTEATDTGTKSNKAMKNTNVKIQDNDKTEDDVTLNASTNAPKDQVN